MQWTPQQKEAIHTQGCNLLVAAAAGAGKTAVLVERIINRLKDPDEKLDVDRLLVVTFTNAAAAQMREKIRRELEKTIKNKPHASALQRQLHLLNGASISTLHAFCLEILRQHFYRLDLDPNFRVADEEEVSLLALEVIEQRLGAWYRSFAPEAPFFALVDRYGGDRDDTQLRDLILSLYTFARSHPWPEHWLKQAAAVFSLAEQGELEVFSWCPALKQEVANQLKGCLEDLAAMICWCQEPQAPQAYLENLYAERDMLEGLYCACAGTWEGLFTGFQNVHFARLKAVRKSEQVDTELQELIKTQRDKIKKIVGDLATTYFSRPPKEHLAALQNLAPLMENLAELVLDFGRSFAQEKAKQGIIDYGDLEQYALEILREPETRPGQLVPSGVARSLQEHYEEVLVDEYQDINQVQEAILQLVSRKKPKKPNRFMVGDVKQSIYRFRLAEPGLFLKKYHTYALTPGQPTQRINLKENFRSNAQVLEGINYFFQQIMTAGVGEIPYDTEAELVCGRRRLVLPGASTAPSVSATPATTPEENEEAHENGGKVAPGLEVNLLLRNEEAARTDFEENEDTGSEAETEEGLIAQLETTELEARWVARQFKNLVKNRKHLWDQKQGTYRPVQYRDMVVLLRTTREQANIFLEAFAVAGVPAYADLGTGYFAAGEIETVLALLQLVDNPQQDIPLVTVLRSPLVGLSPEGLAQIRLCQKKGDFYRATEAAATELNNETGEKVALFLTQLEKWRTLARREPLSSLIETLIYATGFYDYVGGMPGGAQRQANLRLFVTWAGKYEATIFRGLFNFLRFVDRLREKGGDMGSARTLSENEDVVRIMSIHKSKGLEFPIVCVAGLGRRFNFMDLRNTVLFHKEIGLGPQFVAPDRSIHYPSLAKLALKQRIQRETLAEEMRLLYVAMTRAQEKLYLVGTVNNLSSTARTWCSAVPSVGKTLSEAALGRATCYLDWVGPSLLRHSEGRFLSSLAGYPEQSFSTFEARAPLRIKTMYAAQVLDMAETGDEETTGPLAYGAKSPEASKLDLIAAKIQKRLSWAYPYPTLVGKKAEYTVTEIKRLTASPLEEDQASPYPVLRPEPRFVQKAKGLSAAERGSAMHILLQHVDLQRTINRKAVQALVHKLREKEILTLAQAAGVELELIVRFFQQPLGQRLQQATKVYREIPFTCNLPLRELDPTINESKEKVLVQGIIDCLAVEEDGLLLLDYKTDWLGAGLAWLEQVTQTYQNQLRVYALAVERILSQPVKEKYLYFLQHGRAKKID